MSVGLVEEQGSIPLDIQNPSRAHIPGGKVVYYLLAAFNRVFDSIVIVLDPKPTPVLGRESFSPLSTSIAGAALGPGLSPPALCDTGIPIFRVR
jgi:predicted secreted protein